MAAMIDAAVRGAELAEGSGDGHIYQFETTGNFEDDPSLADEKFHGNPTGSYRTQYPLRIVGEILDWVGHPPEV